MMLLTAISKCDFKVLEHRERDCLPLTKLMPKQLPESEESVGRQVIFIICVKKIKLPIELLVYWSTVLVTTVESFGVSLFQTWGAGKGEGEERIGGGDGRKREEGSHGLNALLGLISWIIFHPSANIEYLLCVQCLIHSFAPFSLPFLHPAAWIWQHLGSWVLGHLGDVRESGDLRDAWDPENCVALSNSRILIVGLLFKREMHSYLLIWCYSGFLLYIIILNPQW